MVEVSSSIGWRLLIKPGLLMLQEPGNAAGPGGEAKGVSRVQVHHTLAIAECDPVPHP